MRSSNHAGIVAWGRTSILGSDDYRRRAKEVRERIKAQYAEKYPAARKSFFLKFRMELEIRRELEKLAPRRALYFSKQHA